ncbi:tetratricopeptide repeat-containing sulfotransferase family protein [Salibaculum griseiflavum]|uniref:Uncharacterized protein n=1 Tax=Salibaculum griseiflavum TaxID=1914409 RepID=A0A2V1P3S2_9RHOB|nr:sulfotransferase [Salibaculum griseiflavum]PWG17161.1 hypothetical protein DFK10_07140 [Salibaculum griseiflavum]
MDRISQLLQAGRVAEAVALIKRGLAQRPRDATLLLALAQVHNRGSRDYAQAHTALKKLLKLAPKNAAAHAEMAQVLGNMQDREKAIQHAKRAVALAPKSPDHLYVLGTLYHQTDRLQEARAAIRKSLALRPDHVQTRLLLATVLRSGGDMDAARTLCTEIFEDEPNNLFNFSVYSLTGKLDADDPMMRHFTDVVIPAAEQAGGPAYITALGVLAKLRDDTGDHDAAFTIRTQAKAAEGIRHDNRKYAGFVQAQVQGLTRADYFGGGGSDSETPVLIVGMPRSGSTLLEQVISSHPKVQGVGENPALANLLRGARVPDHDGPALVRFVKGLDSKQAAALARSYLSAVTPGAGKASRIVDKKLHNFELLGLFAKLFPKARILHATRDPMDCCVSCYLQNLSPWHSYTRDLGDLGRYYKQYRRLTHHWQTALPNPIMSVAYEDMVADLEGTARAVIGFLGLDWDDACLNYQQTDNRARTLSVWQVRQPVYKTSVKRWKRYAPHLGPLMDELAPLYPDGLD